MTLEEIKKTGDKKAILKYRTQCAKDSVKEYREQMRDATPEERESVDAYIKSISKPTGVDFDSLSDSQTIHHLTDKAYSELCLLAAKGREALQPSGDAVSRQAVLDMLEDINAETEGVGFYYEHYVDYIKSLPSVNPQEPQTGHWIVVSDGYGDNVYICECSECKDTVWVYKDADRKWNYCPNCGCRMVEEQERSE